jgi:hypothetical protein
MQIPNFLCPASTTTTKANIIYCNPLDRERLLCGRTEISHNRSPRIIQLANNVANLRLWPVIPGVEYSC